MNNYYNYYIIIQYYFIIYIYINYTLIVIWSMPNIINYQHHCNYHNYIKLAIIISHKYSYIVIIIIVLSLVK